MQRETQALRTPRRQARRRRPRADAAGGRRGLAAGAAGRELPLRARQARASPRPAGPTRRSSAFRGPLRPGGWQVDGRRGPPDADRAPAPRARHEHRRLAGTAAMPHAEPAASRRAAFWRGRAPRERQALWRLGGVAARRSCWPGCSGAAGLAHAARGAGPARPARPPVAADPARRPPRSRALRAVAPVSPTQADAALKAATDRLGDAPALSLQGERATVTLHRRRRRGPAAAGSTRRAARRAPARSRPACRAARQGYSGTLSRDPRRRAVMLGRRKRPAVGADGRVDRLGRVDVRRAGLGQVARRGRALGRRRGDASAPLVALIAFAPAAWLAGCVASPTEQRVLLADARGTVWSGSAVPVLTGGAAAATPARCPGAWSGRWCPRGLGFELAPRQDCCLNGTVAMRVRPGLGRIGGHAGADPRRLGRPVAQRLAGRPGHALEHAAARRRRAPRLAGPDASSRCRAAGSSTAAPTSNWSTSPRA